MLDASETGAVCPLCSVTEGNTIAGDDLFPKRLDPDDYATQFENDPGVVGLNKLGSPTPPATDAPVDLYATKFGDEGPVGSAKLVRYFGDYELLGEIARGGMGVVYRARQISLNRVVALKMILSAQLASTYELERFRVEAEAAAGLDHPNIVPIYEVGEHDDCHYYTMKLIEGCTLAERVASRPFAPREAGAVVSAIARGVHHAHRRGILHRDLKPANVLLDAEGIPHVTDFGLAKRTEGDAGLTLSGTVVGTPSYMPPEQASGNTRALTVAVDVYSVGAILYDLLTGRPPFQGGSIASTLHQVLHEEPRRPRQINAAIDVDLETVCLKCLEKAPGRRYESAADLADDLDRWLRGEPIAARATTSSERAWKWARRRPAIASLCGTVLAVSVAALVASFYAWRASVANTERDRDAARDAEIVAARLQYADRDALKARREALARLGDSGLDAAKRNDNDQALLWFANAVRSAAGDADGEQLNRIRVRNWAENVSRPIRNRVVAQFRPIQDRFLAFEFHPTGRYLLALTTTGLDPIWDLRNDASVSIPDAPKAITAAAWSPDGMRLALGSEEGRVEIREFPALRMLDAWQVEPGRVTALTFSPNGRYLAAGGPRGARVREVYERSYTTPYLPHPGAVVALVFNDRGGRLATVAMDGKARIFATFGGTTAPLYGAVPHSLGGFAFSQESPGPIAPRFVDDGQVLVTITNRNELIFRTAETGVIRATHLSPNGQNVTALTSSPDGRRVAAIWASAGRIYAATDAALSVVIPSSGEWVDDVAFSPRGDVLATCGHDTAVRFWSTVPTVDLAATPNGHPLRHPSHPVRVRFSPDGLSRAIAQGDGSICVWRIPTRPAEDYRHVVAGPTRVAMSLDNRRVMAAGTSFRSVRMLESQVLDAATGAPLAPPIRPGGVIFDAAFSPDGRHVATASSVARDTAGRDRVKYEPEGRGGNVQIWNASDGSRVAGPIAMPTEPRGLDFSPDGRHLAVACADGWVMILNLPSGTVMRRIDTGVRSRPANANLWWANGLVKWSPDGRRLVSCEMGPVVQAWDPATGVKLAEMSHSDRIERLVFGVDSDLLLTCARDSQVRVWDLRTGRLAAPPLKHPRGAANAVFAAADGEVWTCGGEGLMTRWDWRRGRILSSFHANGDFAVDFATTPDGRWLITTGFKETVLCDARTGLAVAPPLWGSSAINLGLAMTPDGRRVIVGGFSGELIGYDLKALLTPAAAPADELIRLAEVVSCLRVDKNGQFAPLSRDEWLERWETLRPTAP